MTHPDPDRQILDATNELIELGFGDMLGLEDPLADVEALHRLETLSDFQPGPDEVQ